MSFFDFAKYVLIGLAAAAAVVFVVSIISTSTIREKAKEIAKEKAINAYSLKINEMLKKNEYNEVHIGLRDENCEQIDEFVLKAKDVDNDIYVGREFLIYD